MAILKCSYEMDVANRQVIQTAKNGSRNFAWFSGNVTFNAFVSELANLSTDAEKQALLATPFSAYWDR